MRFFWRGDGGWGKTAGTPALSHTLTTHTRAVDLPGQSSLLSRPSGGGAPLASSAAPARGGGGGAAAALAGAGPPFKLFVGNLPNDVLAADLAAVFAKDCKVREEVGGGSLQLGRNRKKELGALFFFFFFSSPLFPHLFSLLSF